MPSPFHRLPSIFYLLPPTYPTFDLQPSTFNRRPVCLPDIFSTFTLLPSTFYLLLPSTLYLFHNFHFYLLPYLVPPGTLYCLLASTFYPPLPSSYLLLPTFYVLLLPFHLIFYPSAFCLLPSTPLTVPFTYRYLPAFSSTCNWLAFYLPATFYPFNRLPPSTFHLFDLSSTCLLHLPLTTYLLFYLLPSAFYLLPSAFHLHLRPFAFLFTFYLPALLSSTYVLASSTVYRFCLPCRLPLPLPYLPIYPVSHVLSSTFYQAPSTSTL